MFLWRAGHYLTDRYFLEQMFEKLNRKITRAKNRSQIDGRKFDRIALSCLQLTGAPLTFVYLYFVLIYM